jgi:predicted lysophospholipase L1 biosynthesis ABC-type transport system permease subunit
VLGSAIVDAGQTGGQPIVLAATVVAAARSRRRELAVLKALGLIRGLMLAAAAARTPTTAALRAE